MCVPDWVRGRERERERECLSVCERGRGRERNVEKDHRGKHLLQGNPILHQAWDGEGGLGREGGGDGQKTISENTSGGIISYTFDTSPWIQVQNKLKLYNLSKILRATNQNDVSLLYIMLDIHHSGRKHSIWPGVIGYLTHKSNLVTQQMLKFPIHSKTYNLTTWCFSFY